MRLIFGKQYLMTCWIAALVILCTVFAVGSGVFAASSDIPSTWAQEEVDEARVKGLVIGEADQNFQANISRRVFCALVVNLVETVMAQPVAVTIINPFEDTSEVEIIKAYQLGIVKGISATRFEPDAFITREQIAVMMMRGARKLDELKGSSYADVSASTITHFADQNDISSWALRDVQIANGLGIMQGVGGNRINPKGNTTVEQSILLINRMYDGFSRSLGGTGDTSTGDTTIEETVIEHVHTEHIVENRAPQAIANPVVFSVPEQTPLTIQASQLVTDPDGDEVVIIKINGQTGNYNTLYGIVSLTADGRCIYTSNDISTNLTDAFVVTVSDGVNETHVNVRIHVTFTLELNLTIRPAIASVTLNGTAAMNEALTVGMIRYAGNVPATPPVLAYQWMSGASPNGVFNNIPGATSAAYVISQNDLGKYLRVQVTASGSATGSATSAVKGPVGYGFAGGDGTSSSPYQIANTKQFMLLDVVPTSGKHFILVSNIALERNKYIKTTFNGTLNGAGNTVTIALDMPGEAQNVGLFASTGTSARIESLTVAGRINTTQTNYVGGMVGYNRGRITRCLSTVDIDAKDYTGGIAGANAGIITECGVVSGHVRGNGMVGGLVGINLTIGGVANCYAQTDVFGTGNEGGLIGYNKGGVQYCYSAGKVDGYNNRGGLVGHNDGGTVAYSYYDKETSGRNDTGRGIPRTTSQMKTQSTYVAWDFTYIWSMDPGQYPKLRQD
ncbi:S-layer homology domain-containing protein [Desulfitibacter alkalitolerans]|uniref:S-layer homology domain-containing protein n=1 Tax=Desulfitibacter alkalitolerans TaxID=264641 RepID=UPI000484AE38|nr:S-layer homology domain-containing protein [Desulfitibacter alkalitolerans]